MPKTNNLNSLSQIIKDEIEKYDHKIDSSNVGQVVSVGDCIATVFGLEDAMYGELIEFPNNTYGMVMNIEEDDIGVALLGENVTIKEGDTCTRTKRLVSVPVGDEMLGRVVNSLGQPIDGYGPIKADEYRPVENIAPEIMDRQSVNEPLETGIKAIDSMIPGQKNSSLAQIVARLKRYDALKYTTIVGSSAAEPSPMQYLAPYSATSIAEYWMHKGKNVLIIYDDLSKHAVAYRTLLLLLRRSPGREAYPGDIFYLHSRLLERSCRLNKELGGGSITALPIIETQAGDISAYIPTNVISITDGQLFLNTDMFNSGQRPAIDSGLSVSRVGSSAQTKVMKSVSKDLRMALANYHEMLDFSRFGSDLDKSTKKILMHGAILTEVLKQKQYMPLSAGQEIVDIYVAQKGLLDNVAPEDVHKILKLLDNSINAQNPEIYKEINENKTFSDENKMKVEERLSSILASVKDNLIEEDSY